MTATVTLVTCKSYTIGGITFAKNKPRTDISGALAQKLANSPYFKVVFAQPPEAPAPAETAGAAPAAEPQAQAETAPEKTKLVITGGKAQVKSAEPAAEDKTKEGAVSA